MDWAQVYTVIGANLIMMISMYGITVKIMLHQDRKIDENRKDSTNLLQAIQQEMKDFHGRLCSIEEARKK